MLYLHNLIKGRLTQNYMPIPEPHRRYWHPTKNHNLDPQNLTPGSGKRAWWQCPVCSHEWPNYISNQCRRAEPCPYCSNPKSRLHSDGRNSVEKLHPEAVADWDPSNEKKPSEMVPGSKYRAKFICSKDMFGRRCRHQWSARVDTRCKLIKGRKKTAGCPACAGKEVNNYDQRNALSKTNPSVAAELMNERNPEHLNADTITAGCNENLWWKCGDVDSSGLVCGYEFKAQVSSRTQGSDEDSRRICAVCRNRVVHPDGRNSLRTTHPFVTEDWDQELNGDVTPDDVTAGSLKEFHWRCRQTNFEKGGVCNHRWKQRLYSRTQMIQDGLSSHRPCEVCNPGGGYKKHKPGYFYVLSLVNSDGRVIAKKNGITNHPKIRMQRLSGSLKEFRPESHYELEEIHFHQDGAKPDEVEKWAKKQSRLPAEPFDGGHELYEENMFRKFSQQTDSAMDGWEDLTKEFIDELSEALDRSEDE